MRKRLTVLLGSCALFCSGGEKLIANSTGAENFKGYWRSSRARTTFTMENDVIIISGAPESPKGANANSAKALLDIKRKAEDLQNKKFEFSYQIRPVKISGWFRIAIRQTFGDSGGRYFGRVFKQPDSSDQWEEVTTPFSTRGEATKLGLYIEGRYLFPGDRIEFKDMRLVEKNQEIHE